MVMSQFVSNDRLATCQLTDLLCPSFIPFAALPLAAAAVATEAGCAADKMCAVSCLVGSAAPSADWLFCSVIVNAGSRRALHRPFPRHHALSLSTRYHHAGDHSE